MGIIKSVFNFIVTYQVMQLFIFIYFFIENDLFIQIPFVFTIGSYEIDFTIDFNVASLIGFIVAVSILVILAGVQVTVVGGLNDTSTNTLKKALTIFALYTLLSFPTYYIFGLSEYLVSYASIVNFVCFLFYVIYFFADKEGSE